MPENTKTNPLDLSERLRNLEACISAATGPDRELDALIVAVLGNMTVKRYPPQTDFGPSNRWQFWSNDGLHFLGNESRFPVDLLTASLDAADALRRRVLPESERTSTATDRGTCHILLGDNVYYAAAPTEPLAILIATIRALIARHDVPLS